MTPLKPFSVKFTDEVRKKIKAAAEEIGYSENQFIVESVASVLEMIEQPGVERLPRVVVLVQAAREHREEPRSFRGKDSAKTRRGKA